MAFDNLSDEEILQKIQEIHKNNPTDDTMRPYFDEVYKRYYKRAYNLGRFYGLRRYDAEDVVQDAFLKLLLHVNKFRTNLSFSVWFMRIVFNTIRDKFREKKRHGHSDFDGIAEMVSSETQNFFEKLQFQDELQRIIGGIPEKIREVLVMRIYGEMDFDKIAQVLGISTRQVHNRMRQGMDILKKYGKGGDV